MKILVTGATGFVGKHLLKKLSDYETAIVVRTFSDKYQLYHQIIYNEDLEQFKKNIVSFNPDIVIHLASHLTSADDSLSIKAIIDSNVLFTSYLLEALKETEIKLFINTGTFAQYSKNDGILNPAYFYAASKTAVNPIIQYFKNLIGFKSINIIPYTIYGGQSKSKKVIDLILESTDSTNAINMTSGEQILDFIHIDDVIDFYLCCIRNIDLLKDNYSYHLGTGIGTTIKELASLVELLSNKKVNINWGAVEYRPLDIMKAVAPSYIIKEELGWASNITLEDGIKKILEEN